MLNLYIAHRALVRAKVRALRADPCCSADADATDVDRYLEVVRATLSRPRPVCVLMSGLSGSGKTWLATRLAVPLRAVHVRSDLERKRLL